MNKALSDPTDLDGLRQFLAASDSESRLATLGLQQLRISSTAHLEVADAVRAVRAQPGRARIIILTDKTAIKRKGIALRALVEQQLSADHDVKFAMLDDGHPALHADERMLDAATEAVKSSEIIVTIGSGTMTDIGKVAGHRNGGIPQIAIQTAASVDGFTDNVSVVLWNGVKRTIPSSWPAIVLADAATIMDAPRALNTSGFGEAISLFTAPADWYLANLVGLDATFHPASMALLNAAAAEPPDWSAGIARGEPDAIQKLTRLLALRGIVSGVSNTTACLSGVEHVISHMLDLHHSANHLPIGLHGAQVGVASLVAAKLWRHAISANVVSVDRLCKPDAVLLKSRIKKRFGHLGQAIADECWRDCEKKLALLDKHWERVTEVVAAWSTHVQEFSKMVQPAEKLRRALIASGSPPTFQALSPSISPELSRWAVTNCHLMRNRFNLVDLLDMLGLWTEELINWAIADVMEAG